MGNRLFCGCCVGCRFVDIPLTRDVANPTRIISFNSLRVQSTVLTTTSTQVSTYVDRARTNQSPLQSVQDTADFDETTETVTDSLAIPLVVPSEVVNSAPATSNTYDPPEAEADTSIRDYTITTTIVQVRTSFTRSIRRRIAIEFDTRHVSDFGRLRASTQPVIARFDLVSRFRSATSSANTATPYQIRWFADHDDWVDDIADFDSLLSATTTRVTSSIMLGQRYSLLGDLPSEPKDSLTVLIDSQPSSGALSIEFMQMVIDSWTAGFNPSELEQSWRDRVDYQNDAGKKTWRIRSSMDSNDFKLQASIVADGTSPVTHLPHDWTLALMDSSVDSEVLAISYRAIQRRYISPDFEHESDAYPDLPDFIGLRPSDQDFGTLSIHGLGIELDLGIVWQASLFYSVVLALHDDTLILAFEGPPTSQSNDDGLFGLARDTIFVWADDGSFHAGSVWFPASGDSSSILFREWIARQQNYIALKRDPLVTPSVNFEFRTETAGVDLLSVSWQETEKLTAIGEPRVPYDPDLDETTRPKRCEQPYEGCGLVGSEEDLRLDVDVDWGVYQGTFPLAGSKCTAAGRKHFGEFPATDYLRTNNVPTEGKQFFEVSADAAGEMVHVAFARNAQRRRSLTGRLVTPFSLSNPRANLIQTLDGDPSDPGRATVSVKCTLFRNDAGYLAIRTIAEFGFVTLSSQNGVGSLNFAVGTSLNVGVRAGNGANFASSSFADRLDITAGGAGYTSDPCLGMPVQEISTVRPKPVLSNAYPIGMRFQRQTLTWETSLGVIDVAEIADIPEIELPASSATGWIGDDYPSRTAQKLVAVTIAEVEEGVSQHEETEMRCSAGVLGPGFFGNSAHSVASMLIHVDYETEDAPLDQMVLKIRPHSPP